MNTIWLLNRNIFMIKYCYGQYFIKTGAILSNINNHFILLMKFLWNHAALLQHGYVICPLLLVDTEAIGMCNVLIRVLQDFRIPYIWEAKYL